MFQHHLKFLVGVLKRSPSMLASPRFPVPLMPPRIDTSHPGGDSESAKQPSAPREPFRSHVSGPRVSLIPILLPFSSAQSPFERPEGSAGGAVHHLEHTTWRRRSAMRRPPPSAPPDLRRTLPRGPGRQPCPRAHRIRFARRLPLFRATAPSAPNPFSLPSPSPCHLCVRPSTNAAAAHLSPPAPPETSPIFAPSDSPGQAPSYSCVPLLQHLWTRRATTVQRGHIGCQRAAGTTGQRGHG